MKPKFLLIIAFTLIASYSFTQTQVTFYTNKGSFVVSLEEAKRPITTANFLKLVKAKFYDKTLFYRVIKTFVIQGGNEAANAAAIKDELTPAFSNLQKTIAMANAGPNTGSSEIYINTVNNTSLDKSYTAFGTVITNFTVVQTIAAVPTTGANGNPPDKPLTNVVMDSVRITFTPTSINEMEKQFQTIGVFPNPTNGLVYISHTENITDFFVTDMIGKKILLPPNKNENTIDLHSAPAGIYFLHLKTPYSMEVKKIIKE